VTIRYLSVCSGIEAASVAWEPLGWTPVAFAEIDPFPSAVLKHRFPNIPNLGDFTRITAADVGPIDLLVGGTPCQSFSVAGLRGGLADDRGNLALEFLRLADRTRPRWLVWENVPGVLSSNGGRDFGAILGGMVELGYGFAYRVLDAQYFGVPQRRRRVFVVGYLGDWRPAAAVLFERHSLQGHSPPRREKRERIAPTLSARTRGGGGHGTDFEVDGGLIAHSLRAEGFDASDDGTERGTPIVPIQSVQSVRDKKQNGIGIGEPGDEMFTLTARDQHAVAFAENSRAELGLEGGDGSVTGSLKTGGGKPWQGYPVDQFGMQVRRLTPLECERLQGFPDDWTLVPYRGKPAADGPRYKAIGNSFAVPVVRWIGERIALVEEALSKDLEAAA